MYDRTYHHSRPSKLPARGGATLIELLVVIVIMVILAAAAVPVMAPALQNRQVREASRIVNGFLTGARNRAMLNGRPVGVVLDRLPGLSEACVTLSYAEVPVPYSGDTTNSTVLIQLDPNNGNQTSIAALTPQYNTMTGALTNSIDVGWQGTVRVGDLIRLNYRGPYFQIGQPINTSAFNSSTGFFVVDPATSSGTPSAMWPLFPLPGSPAPLPSNGTYRYQIIRAPVKMAAGALQLPGSTVIDLDFSGFDVGDPFGISPWVSAYSFQPIWPYAGVSSPAPGNCPFPNSTTTDTSPVIISFAPSGAVDSVWCWPGAADSRVSFFLPTTPYSTSSRSPLIVPVKPTTPIHLLIGKRELLPLPTTPPIVTDPTDPQFKPYCNWHDLTNFWVSVNPQSGLVTTVENNAAMINTNSNIKTNNGVGFGLFSDLMQARQLALESLRTGGR